MSSHRLISSIAGRRAFASATREELPRGVFRSFERNSSPPDGGASSAQDGQLPAGITRVTGRGTGAGQLWPGEGNRSNVREDIGDVPKELPKGMARVGRDTPNVKLRRPPPPPPEEPAGMRLPKGLVRVGNAEKRAERGLPKGVTPISGAKDGMELDVDEGELPRGLKRMTDVNAAPVRKESLENISIERRSEAYRGSMNQQSDARLASGTIPVVQRPTMYGGVMITPVETSEPSPASLPVPKSSREIAAEVTPAAVDILRAYLSGKKEPARMVLALRQLAGHHQNVEKIEGLENLQEYQRLLEDMGASFDLARFSGAEVSEVAEYLRILGAPGVTDPSKQLAKRLSFQICERLHELSPVERIRTIYVITTWLGLRLDDYTHWALQESIDDWIDSPEVDDATVLPALYLLCEPGMRKRSYKVLAKPKVFTRMEGMVNRLEIDQLVDMVRALGKHQAQKSIVVKALERLEANPEKISDGSLPSLAPFLQSTEAGSPDLSGVAAHARKRLSNIIADESSINRNAVASLVVELAKMPSISEGVLDEAVEMIRLSASQLGADVLPKLLLLYTAEGKPLHELEVAVMGCLREIQPKGIAKLCLAAAAGGLREKEAMVALYGECLDRARRFDPEDFIDAFYSMSLAGLVNDDALVDKVDIEKIIRNSPVSALPSLAWSLVVANFNRPMPWSVLCSRIIQDPTRAIGDVQFDAMGVCVKGDPHQAALLYEALASAAAMKWFVIDEPSVVAGMESWKAAWTSKFCRPGNLSHSPVQLDSIEQGLQQQQDPSSRMPWTDILNKLDISHRMDVEIGYKWPLWDVPILMSELSCVIDPKLKKSQIVHYYSGLTTGTAKLRHRIWNAKGYAVFGIGDDQFPDSSGGASEANCDFLAGLLDIVSARF
ncbi:hypothetical protein FOL47_011063 [Perkinsus chesapeaki]|uniref:Uncharacterized protein n=1 Tax=Perkinsus chesapeaki TaxID=330153 RepID=A0A7J6MNG4_PERCH|nr:hypothetical protein FOL47_011063 [Perkinsus chesapeaki]